MPTVPLQPGFFGCFFRAKQVAFCLALVLISLGSQTGNASGLERQQLVYSCQIQIAPDQLIIAGGVSAQSISPAQAGTQIDLRMHNIKAFVLTKQGSLALLDRLRAARNPDRRDRKPGDEFLPFLQIQRFEAIFPVNSNVDQVLESLFKLGMDRYGKSVRIDEYSDHNFSSLTRYRFSALKPKLDAFIEHCRASKLKAACANAKTCDQANSYATLTARYLTEEGARDLTLNVAGDAKLGRITEAFEPSSAAAITFEVQGSITRSHMSIEK